MGRCHLKGSEGDALQAVLCKAVYFLSLAAANDRQEGVYLFCQTAGEQLRGIF
jgi:hypothetical protein